MHPSAVRVSGPPGLAISYFLKMELSCTLEWHLDGDDWSRDGP